MIDLSAHKEERSTATMNYFLISTITLLILGAIAVVLTLTLEGRRSSSGSSSLQRTEGQSGPIRVRKYSTSISVHSRLLTGKITVEFENERDCAASGGLTLQLPVGARVADLVTEASDECQMSGVVQGVFDAQESFRAQSSAGKSAALLQAWDLQNYPLWASVPPSGNTKVYIVYEELLSRKNYQIPFQVPIGPGLQVDEISMEIKISEPNSGVSMFDVEPHGVGSEGDKWRRYGQRMEVHWIGSTGVQASLRLRNVGGHDFPRMVRAWYDYNPSMIRDEGVLSGSQSCISYLFNPSSALRDAIPKAIVFVIDVSGSMKGEKLDDAKSAFRSMITTLGENEIFSIQAFSKESSKKSWGPSLATTYARQESLAFVDSLVAKGGTNLNGALLDAFTTLKDVQDMVAMDNRRLIPTIIFLSDGRASSGVTDRPEILRNVRLGNEVNAKIFSLGFGKNADMPLLTAISVQNRGRSLPIYTGYGDSALQLQNFYDGELRDVLLSDVSIEVSSNYQIESLTQSTFPIFAGGSEITVRARPSSGVYFNGDVTVTTTAVTSDGPRQWSQYTRIESPSFTTNPFDRECTQSFAHAKISEILAFAEAMESLGSELYGYVEQIVGYGIGISVNRASEMEIISSIKGYAFDLAIEAGLVWPGLTAMVTLENDNCELSENDICFEGDILRGGFGHSNPHNDGTTGIPEEGPMGDAGVVTSIAYGAATVLSFLCTLIALLYFFTL